MALHDGAPSWCALLGGRLLGDLPRAGVRRLRGCMVAPPEGEVAGRPSIGIVIGPEGGIAPEEAERMEGVGARCVTLGPRILRAETAAIVAAALAMNSPQQPPIMWTPKTCPYFSLTSTFTVPALPSFSTMKRPAIAIGMTAFL